MSSKTKKLLEDQKKHLKKLASIKPVMQVKTSHQAGSEKVINYVMKRLDEGERYDVIRRELGLGMADKDRKWRKIREIVTNLRMPELDEDEFLEAKDSMNYWMTRLEDMVKEVSDNISSKGNAKNIANLLKAKLDSIHKIIEAKSSIFENYVKLKQLKKQESSRNGPTIIIQNNIPRPEKNIEDIKSTVIEASGAITDKE